MWARLAPDTVTRLAARLPHGLEAVNPVDAAGPLSADFARVFRDCLGYLMDDPGTAIGLHTPSNSRRATTSPIFPNSATSPRRRRPPTASRCWW